jgi:hypothetical protein
MMQKPLIDIAPYMYYKPIEVPSPEIWEFHNWLVTHRTALKSVREVMRSLKSGIKVWRYKS